MDLNLNVLEGLKLVGDIVNVPDKPFESLVNLTYSCLSNKEPIEPNEFNSLQGVDSSVAKQAFYGLNTLIVEAARKNIEEAEIRSLLEECKWPNDRQDPLLDKIKVIRRELQMNLVRTDSSYPYIFDVDWRVDYCIKSNQVEKLNDSSYMVSLKTQEPNNKEGNVEFFCSVDQLQDLVSKLKDASKTLEKASQG
ncbi:COMM domain-containing protein 3-like [Clytia hemisphaerica]|uniref:COMM domain-containing protein 3 n=1 Tax=Clytia hemisphaerica TaxID=252671 RepID=A0A7M5WI82_9CNID